MRAALLWPVVEAFMQPVTNVAASPFPLAVPETTEKKTRQHDNAHGQLLDRLDNAIQGCQSDTSEKFH